jgi:hypothetical protein
VKIISAVLDLLQSAGAHGEANRRISVNFGLDCSNGKYKRSKLILVVAPLSI